MPSPIAHVLRAAELLRQGYQRIRVQVCGWCGQKNRVDHWRVLFGRATFVNCGRCGSRIAKRAG